jgi:hypothetical protein
MNGVTTLRRIGQAIDRRYLKKVGAISIPGSSIGLLLVCFHEYEGKKPIELKEKTIIHPGDRVGEFHFSNIRITEIADEPSDRSMEWRLLEMLRQEFAALAIACHNGTIDPDIKGFYGVNVLAAGAKRLGFTLIPIPKGWDRWWLGFWESMLRLIYYSFKTKKKATLKRTMDPYEIWMSRGHIIKQFLKDV